MTESLFSTRRNIIYYSKGVNNIPSIIPENGAVTQSVDFKKDWDGGNGEINVSSIR